MLQGSHLQFTQLGSSDTVRVSLFDLLLKHTTGWREPPLRIDYRTAPSRGVSVAKSHREPGLNLLQTRPPQVSDLRTIFPIVVILIPLVTDA